MEQRKKYTCCHNHVIETNADIPFEFNLTGDISPYVSSSTKGHSQPHFRFQPLVKV